MSKCLKKLFAIMVSLAILIACIPTVSVFAATASGTCGENVTWSLDTDTGVLTISGSGDMSNYDWSNDAPWYSKSSYIKSANIENGVTRIGYEAFIGCSSLTSVTLPDSVTSIGNWAFEDCSSLTSVTIPNSVTSIGDGAFWYCSSLTSITIPDSVTSIGSAAFSGCFRLTSVNIQNGVTSIGDVAFYDCSSLTSVDIPDSVTSIGDQAFKICSNLTSVTIPDSVTSIGEDAFYGCYNLKIYGYRGTVAETYALQYDFEFIPITDLVDSENNISVSGAVSAGTELKVDKVTITDTRVTYDISLVQNGEEVQPEIAVTVKIPLPTGMNSVECKVYREEENGNYTNMNAVYKDGFMIFITEHFSKYVLTSENLGVIIGDANGDGRINNKDLGLLMQKLNGWAVEIDDAVADVNADGKVNNKDYGLLMQYVNGWEVVIG